MLVRYGPITCLYITSSVPSVRLGSVWREEHKTKLSIEFMSYRGYWIYFGVMSQYKQNRDYKESYKLCRFESFVIWT